MALVDGIWEYSEGDTASPAFSELLNLLGDSVRDRFTAVEDDMNEDTGWTTVALAGGLAGSCRYRRLRNVVFVTWTCTSSFAANATALPLVTLPDGYRPPGDIGAAVSGLSLYPWSAAVRSNGQVQVRNNHSAAQTTMYGYAVYTVD